MELVEVIRSVKSDVSIGHWQSGKILPSAWPMRTASLHLSRDYWWRIVRFEALGQRFRILIMLSMDKETYRAVLALEDGKQLRILCHHELHTGHHNWHCHFCRGAVEDVYPAVWRDRDRFQSYPRFGKVECTVPFGVTKENAVTVAATRYRFAAQGELV